LYQSLYCDSLIKVALAAYYDCDHFVLPTVDLFVIERFMICKFLVVLNVLVDVYMLVHVCFVLIKLVYYNMCRECVVCIGKWHKF
jgi:hypothetical protein